MIELKQVTKEYGRATVLKNITLTLEEPGIVFAHYANYMRTL